MCQATVFLLQDGRQEEIARDVVSMERTVSGWVIKSLLEESIQIQGRIDKIDFLKHTVTLNQERS